MKTLEKPSKFLDLGHFEIVLEKENVSYVLRRSLRARLVWLQMHHENGLTVTVPRNYDLDELPPFLISKSRWILRHLKRFPSDPSGSPVDPAFNQPLLCFQGNPLHSYEENHNKLYRLPDASVMEYGGVLDWLKQQARETIPSRVLLHSKKIGVNFARISLRDQKTRWGSCSHVGNLNFNWRLIMVPEPVLDYVVIHELCHLKRMSHSKAFWNVVEKYCPDWKEKRRWLNKHSHELHHFHSSSV
jgi:predicted metal-dependent hydrolase